MLSRPAAAMAWMPALAAGAAEPIIPAVQVTVRSSLQTNARKRGRPFRRSVLPDFPCPAKGADIDFFQNGSEDLTL